MKKSKNDRVSRAHHTVYNQHHLSPPLHSGVKNNLIRRSTLKIIINITSIILGLLSLFAYYTTFYTDLFLDTGFSFWYLPGAVIFVISIIAAIIGILKANRLINIIVLLLSLFYLVHFSSLFLLV